MARVPSTSSAEHGSSMRMICGFSGSRRAMQSFCCCSSWRPMARTLAIKPQLILLDEPFAALDAHTRTKLQAEFLRLWEASASTVVMVTHDIVEALLLADRIIVFSARPGRIVDDIAVTWPRPRDIEDLRYTPEFTGLASKISSLLRVQEADHDMSASSSVSG